MGNFSNRRWVFLNTSETGSLDFSQVLETNSGSLRLNNSGSRTFVKYDGSMPSSVSGLSSKSAEYNKKNYETKFKENILINYLAHNIKTNNLDLSFEKNLAKAYNKVEYDNNNTKLYADILEIDLITKNSKIFMNEDYKKINIFTNN